MLRPMLHRNVCMCEPDAVLLAKHAGVVEIAHQPGGGRVDRERVDAAAGVVLHLALLLRNRWGARCLSWVIFPPGTHGRFRGEPAVRSNGNGRLVPLTEMEVLASIARYLCDFHASEICLTGVPDPVCRDFHSALESIGCKI